MEIIVATVALCVAFWQLKLQRDEMRLNSRVNSLIHIAGLLRDKIKHHEHIIENLKAKNADWAGHAYRVNKELRPLLAKVDNELIDAVAKNTGGIDVKSISQALKLSTEERDS